MLQKVHLRHHRHLLADPGHGSKLRPATGEQRRLAGGDAQLGDLTLREELTRCPSPEGAASCRECASREPEPGLYTTARFHHLEI